MKTFYVYLLASQTRTLYIGVTSNLLKRIAEHRTWHAGAFTSRYRVNKLVYFESTPNARAAIEREKQIKKWRRSKKVELVDSSNPMWKDLAEGLV